MSIPPAADTESAAALKSVFFFMGEYIAARDLISRDITAFIDNLRIYIR